MTLRLKINLIVGALTTLFVLALLVQQLDDDRQSVNEEVVAAHRVALQMLNRVVWASGTGFGDVGPYAHKGGQDILIQAMSGVMWRRQSDETPLSVYPTTLCDYTAGMHLVQGVLLALFARERTGEGQKVDIRMFDSMLHMQMQEAATQLNRGQEVNWAAMPLSGVFPTSDGAVCFVGAFKQQPLRDLCQALELGDELWQRLEEWKAAGAPSRCRGL